MCLQYNFGTQKILNFPSFVYGYCYMACCASKWTGKILCAAAGHQVTLKRPISIVFTMKLHHSFFYYYYFFVCLLCFTLLCFRKLWHILLPGRWKSYITWFSFSLLFDWFESITIVCVCWVGSLWIINPCRKWLFEFFSSSPTEVKKNKNIFTFYRTASSNCPTVYQKNPIHP